MGIFILTLIAVNWAALAAYVGLSAFLATQPSASRRAVHLFTAAVILAPTVCFLIDQNFYHWLDNFILRGVINGRAFYAGPFVLNAAFFGGMTLSWISSYRLPDWLRKKVRLICLCAALPPLAWVVSDARTIFLPLLFVPNAEFLLSRVLFLTCFALVSFGTYCLLAATAESP